MFGRFLKGISWVEIAVLGAVLLSLIVLTVPRFAQFKCRAKQSEARFELARLHAAEKLYFSENGKYTSFEDLLGKDRVRPSDRYYNYFTKGEVSSKTFSLQAKGKDKSAVKGDLWEIDQDKRLVNTQNACLR